MSQKIQIFCDEYAKVVEKNLNRTPGSNSTAEKLDNLSVQFVEKSLKLLATIKLNLHALLSADQL